MFKNFHKSIENFKKAIDRGNIKKVKSSYSKLQELCQIYIEIVKKIIPKLDRYIAHYEGGSGPKKSILGLQAIESALEEIVDKKIKEKINSSIMEAKKTYDNLIFKRIITINSLSENVSGYIKQYLENITKKIEEQKKSIEYLKNFKKELETID